MKNRYHISQITLHWVTLLMIILTYSAMLLKDSVPDEQYDNIRLLHFNFGIIVWLLMFSRLALRHIFATPPITPALSHWQELASKLLHWVLYLLFLALPILGVFMMAYGGRSWEFLGMQIPQFVTPNLELRSSLRNIHETLATSGYFLIGFHAVAALFHHYIRRDDTVVRMMPGK